MADRRDALARRRRMLALSQEDLATQLGVNRSTVARWERGQTDPQPWNRPDLCRVLAVDLQELEGLLQPPPTGGQNATPALSQAGAATLLPAGRSLAAAALPTERVHLVAGMPGPWQVPDLELAYSPARSLLAVETMGDGVSVFDARLPGRGCMITEQALDAYAWDAMTCGLLWALHGYESALLDDDANLAAMSCTTGPDLPSTLHASLGKVDLEPISRMFLGSQLCADHITVHLSDGDTAGPTFWTREQRGEEAATWLLFRHKYEYLAATASASPSPNRGGRIFCVPESAVADSPHHERVLLLMAIALMEALGIRVWLCTEPGYSQVDGFALVEGTRAVIASWVRTAGEPLIGVATRPALLRGFADTAFGAQQSDALSGDTAASRLAASAEYLRIDPAWFQYRCAQLAAAGTGGLLRVRSRLLGLDGVETALRFAARTLPRAFPAQSHTR
jgi:DNA-binding XRE family transcriptional regulator